MVGISVSGMLQQFGRFVSWDDCTVWNDSAAEVILRLVVLLGRPPRFCDSTVGVFTQFRNNSKDLRCVNRWDESTSEMIPWPHCWRDSMGCAICLLVWVDFTLGHLHNWTISQLGRFISPFGSSQLGRIHSWDNCTVGMIPQFG